MKTFLALLTVLLATILLGGCVPAVSTPNAGANMVNPASANCGKNQGQTVIRKDNLGNEYGVCVFPDKTECDEWAYFRGQCKPGDYQVAPTPQVNPPYRNETFGFTIDPQSGWFFNEAGRQVKFTRDGYVLTVSFLWNTEAVMPALPQKIDGELATGAKLTFLGQELPTHNLVYKDQVRRVIYGGWVNAGQLGLVMWLDGADGAGIPPNVIDEAGKIVESFKLISGETPEIEIQDIPE